MVHLDVLVKNVITWRKAWLTGGLETGKRKQNNYSCINAELMKHANLCGINWGDGKCGFLEVRAPRKSWRSESQSESKGPHCYGPCSHVPAGLPRGEVTERSEDQGEGKGPHRYGPCSPSPVCASPWAKCGRGDTTFRPDFIINR